MKAKQLPLDKTKHFMGGVAIALVVGVLGSLVLLDPISCALSGFTASVLISTAKEAIWDNWIGRGTEDRYDLYATMAGGALGALIVWGFLTYSIG